MVFCNQDAQRAGEHYKWSHNPYFNRWFSAISKSDAIIVYDTDVTILILIDGFLQ